MNSRVSGQCSYTIVAIQFKCLPVHVCVGLLLYYFLLFESSLKIDLSNEWPLKIKALLSVLSYLFIIPMMTVLIHPQSQHDEAYLTEMF